jgi:hypothetical protein
MSVKIWQVPNKSKAMAQVFARKSGAHSKERSRVREKQQWLKEAIIELTQEELDANAGGSTNSD